MRSPQRYRSASVVPGALDDWLERVGDWSEKSEADMVSRFQPGGEQQRTVAPTINVTAGRLVLASATEGASLGYRINDAAWQVYSAPVPVPGGARITAKAVRYGFAESDEVAATAP